MNLKPAIELSYYKRYEIAIYSIINTSLPSAINIATKIKLKQVKISPDTNHTVCR